MGNWKRILAVAGAFAFAGLMLSPAAQAAPARPALAYNQWYAYNGDGNLRNNASDYWILVFTAGTELSAATDCNGSGYCEHETPDGTDCFTYSSVNYSVYTAPCGAGDDQLWNLTSVGNGLFLWQNLKARDDNCDGLCCGQGEQLLAAAGNDQQVTNTCGSSQIYGNDQIWET